MSAGSCGDEASIGGERFKGNRRFRGLGRFLGGRGFCDDRGMMIRWIVMAVAGVALLGCSGAKYSRGVVAADHRVASEAGVEMLKRGGNAVDAAVATSFALSVVRPYSCGVGGGGFMVIRFDNHPKHGRVEVALDYREVGPGAMTADFYTRQPRAESSSKGGTAVGVPGTVAGLLHALETYGTLDRTTVLGPAIRAAEEGFVADASYVQAAKDVSEWIAKKESRKATYRFVWERFCKEGQVKKGDRIRLPEQAGLLRIIAEKGWAGFYEGDVAEAIVKAVRGDGGVMTTEDLKAYRVRSMEPLKFAAFGHQFLTMPPPSSGGVAMGQAMGILERTGGAKEKAGSANYVHLMAEALKHAFSDRARWMGDPAFAEVPVGVLLSKEYLDERARMVSRSTTRPAGEYGTVTPDDKGTSHFGVVDAKGNAVACTETINLEFGSVQAVAEFGFALNDEMDDFTAEAGKPNAFGLIQSARNAPAAGKRPLSSMTPTIGVDEKGLVKVVAGASGGPRIISSTMQVILNVLLEDMGAAEAVAAARLHHQWLPDELRMEKGMMKDEVVGELKRRGHKVSEIKGIGNVQVIKRVGGGWDAASDPRKGGRPAGY